MKKPEFLVLALALLAALAKAYCAATTGGTLDVVCFREFGRILADQGLISLYEQIRIFNHTPLVGTLASIAYETTAGREQLFAFLVRLPAILADLVAVGALLWLRRRTGQPPWWALALFAASPVAFMISGFHGNVDSVVACGLLLTALACFSGQARLCGLLLGLSCQVKVIPLFVAPVFFFFWWQRGQAGKFFAIATATIFVGWAWPLLTIPGVFLRQVLGYSSMWGTWGIGAILRFSGAPGLDGIKMSAAGWWLSEALKLGVMALVLWLAWRRRAAAPLGILTTLSLAWLVFFVFAPGFGVQYLAWCAPFLLVHSARWYAAVTAASSVALFAFYTIVCGALPWDRAYEGLKTAPQWIPWLLLPWLALAAALWATRRDWSLAETAPQTDAEASAAKVAFAPPAC